MDNYMVMTTLYVGTWNSLWIFLELGHIYNEVQRHQIKFQPSGEGGTRLPPATPAKSKMAARGPQNGRRGLERYLPLRV